MCEEPHTTRASCNRLSTHLEGYDHGVLFEGDLAVRIDLDGSILYGLHEHCQQTGKRKLRTLVTLGQTITLGFGAPVSTTLTHTQTYTKYCVNASGSTETPRASQHIPRITCRHKIPLQKLTTDGWKNKRRKKTSLGCLL